MLRRFRQRHQSNNPLNDWQQAEQGSKPAAAFLAIALDPGVLDTLDGKAAFEMAAGAELYGRRLHETIPGRESSPVGAAVATVLAALKDWNANHKPFAPKGDFAGGASGGPVVVADIFRDKWLRVRGGFPQFDPASAAMCMQSVGELGIGGLERSDESELLLVGACRFAAWSVSAKRMAIKPARPEQAAQTLVLAQEWWWRRHLQALDVGYTGPLGAPWAQALSVAQDAAACSRSVLARHDGPGSDGVELWEQAAMRHAYAAVALRPDALADLDVDSAREIARRVISFALAAETGADWVVMPRLPEGPGINLPRTIAAGMQRLARA